MTKYGAILLLLALSVGRVCADTLDVVIHGPIGSIKEALELADSGDVIRIHPGLYQEGRVVVDKPVTLLGIDYPQLDGQDQHEVLIITSDHVTIKGLQIQNVGTSYTQDRAGILLDGVKHCQIVNNRLSNCFFGIYLKKSSDCHIIGNEVVGDAQQEMSSGNALHLWHSKRIRIQENLVKQHRDGIYLEFVDESTVDNNISIDNLRYGLHFMFSNDNQYTKNTFRSNGAGVAVMFSRNIRMNENLFENNWGMASYGLLLKEIYDGEIVGNSFLKNTIGIYAESANRLIIENNDFKSNGWALKILGSCLDNVFRRNNFYTNTFDLTTNGKNHYNRYEENYWSEYRGYDLDGDGFGDVAHRPIKMYSYVVGRVDVSIILLRSLFVDLMNFAEKVTPVFIPESLVDPRPLMRPRL